MIGIVLLQQIAIESQLTADLLIEGGTGRPACLQIRYDPALRLAILIDISDQKVESAHQSATFGDKRSLIG